jgi:phospholipid/cholesterol/gamma-HCH transport system permease protein
MNSVPIERSIDYQRSAGDAMNYNSLAAFRGGPERLEIVGSGAWTAVNAAGLQALIDSAPLREAQRVEINMDDVHEFDTFGAWALERMMRRGGGPGDISLLGLPERFRGLFDKVRETNRRKAPRPGRDNWVLTQAEAIGRRVADAGSDGLQYIAMLGSLVAALGSAIVAPPRLRVTSLVYQLDRVGVRSVPIIVLITTLIGAIIAQQGIFHFRKFGADDYVVDLVGILILREIAVLIVSIMVAGRSGSSYTAELGSMKMREEIDALRTMGRDPVEVLILPRVLALTIALPLLTFVGAVAALYGGGVVAWIYGGMEPSIFISRLRDAVSVADFEVGIIKAPFMAIVIGVVACTEGLNVKGSTESLGLQTTASVVKSIFMVIVLDGIFAMFFSSIGM